MEVQCETYIRWMTTLDMPMVLAIETESFDSAWTEKDFLRCMREQHAIGMVAEQGNAVAGFMFYEIQRSRYHILNFAVNQRFRRRGIGRDMVSKLKEKAARGRRPCLTLEVGERSLDAQLFFKAMGFMATEVLRGFYDTPPEDAYHMRYTHAEEPGTRHEH